jgi:hypothetical protein
MRVSGCCVVALMVAALACGSAPPPLVVAPRPVAVAPAPPPPPACGAVEIDDHTSPANDGHARLVRDTMRQKLAALGGCARPYRVHVDMTLEQLGADGLRVSLRLIIYGKSGALAGEIPTKVSINHSLPGDVTSHQALLRAGAEQAAQVFAQNFH